MKKVVTLIALGVSLFANEIIIKPSSYSVDTTVKNIKAILDKKGLHVFSVIDHAKGAKKVGMKMNEAKVIIFGNPKMGTLLMQDDITMALDLPLKIVVYSDSAGHTQMAYREGSSFSVDHKITKQKILKKIDGALDKITTKAGSK